MNIKKFTASNTHEAMLEIRNVFGREAIIVANRQTADGVEILATDSLDDLPVGEPVAKRKTTATKRTATRTRKTTAGSVKKKTTGKSDSLAVDDYLLLKNNAVTVEAVSGTDGEELEKPNGSNLAKEREIADLRGALDGLTHSGALTTSSNIAEMTLIGRLVGAGLGPAMVQQLVAQARPVINVDAGWKKSLRYLKKQIHFKPGEFTTEGGTFVFHGPAGAGKTTVICKLAMQYLASNSPSKLAIVSSGEKALSQKDGLLSAFSQLLQIPVHHAECPEELDHCLRELRRKKLILIDTPALDTNNLVGPNSSIDRLESKRMIEHCLVVSASMQGSCLDHIFGCLAESTIESVILTRMDETRQIGVAIDCLLRSGMQSRYCSDAPDLHCELYNDTKKVLMAGLASLNPSSLSPAAGRSTTNNDSRPVANWLESAILV